MSIQCKCKCLFTSEKSPSHQQEQSLIDLSIAISTCYTNGRSTKPRPVPSTWSAKTLPTRPMSARFPTRVSIAHRTKTRHASMTPKGWARSNSLPPLSRLHTSRFKKNSGR
ncbi:hypothetical protein CEXT_339311 [Caerostris extrusa]|uniref:Uncharacterized protein n=1 Tax=Caerostris extrusa TaxID=172846 RepID=A0AAV4TRB0_CAEEX|nr:hypothetical protein CEXT_339311 [Caerostris extrusa]